MKFENPFKLQNWKFKKFLIVILFFQISLLGLFALNKLGVNTPIIRPLVGFIYLSFIPGYLLLRILRLHNLSSIESFLYAIGLSLFMDMFVGFLINMLYPILGITDKPISEIPITLTMAGVIFLLCIVAYFRDKNYNNPDFIDLKDILNPQVLFLSLIPFMAIFGTYLVNYYHNNILLMIMIVVIALVALIVGFTNWIDKKYYPYAIWVMAIALVWHITLIGNNVHIADGERYVPILTLSHGMANLNINNNYFSIVGNTILTPMMVLFFGLSITTIYKLVYPFIISFISLGIYSYIKILKILKIEKEIFFAVFLYISKGSFFSVVIPRKQELAMFFLVLIYMVLFKSKSNLTAKNILLIIFMISLLWSHYGTASLFIGMILSALIIMHLLNIYIKNINFKTINFVVLCYIILYGGWYIFISNSSVIDSIVNIGNAVINSIIYDFNIESSRGGVVLTAVTSIFSIISKAIGISLLLFAIIGCLKSTIDIILRKVNNKYLPIYLSFSLYWFVILISTLLPYFAVMGVDRLSLLAYILLSPYTIIGFKTIIFEIYKRLRINNTTTYNLIITKKSIKIFSVILSFYLLLSTGFINEVFKCDVHSISLSRDSIMNYGDMRDIGTLYLFSPQDCDILMAKWISKNRNNCLKIWITKGNLDATGVFQTFGLIPYNELHPLTQNINISKLQSCYICLVRLNIKEKIGVENNKYASKLIWYNITNSKYYSQLKLCNKIYDNGGSQVLLS
ncbi:DUF2206 domain-containing protein [Methanothermococcus okinawensis]|uniref:Uncharacterized protein n=1 Tax=Methanothermococcus okinawensis (strain DSM 14208 / JCM 11175 / IH1) TaxID=647113 RepID=F8AJS5_METOI|nr:DUF2206 domain-containing protein [Methanothermococcus okinawensis]AEH07273.1 Protein of unknown function DUF2206, membrane [Methanothermococcus okinawensis IH1]